MRIYPLFLGTFFLVSLIATVPIFHEYVAMRSMFEAECGKPIEEYICIQNQLDPTAQCKSADEGFPNADLEFIRVFLNSPPLVKQATCSLEQINFVRYLNEAPGTLFYENGQLSIAWSMLKKRPFLFEDRVLWSHTGHKFSDAHVKYADRRELRIQVQQPVEPTLAYDPGIGAAFSHEIARHIEQSYLQGDAQRCFKASEQAEDQDANSNNCSFLGDKQQTSLAIDMNKDRAFTRAYDICSPDRQFAQAFSALMLKQHFGYSFYIFADEQLVLAQDEMLAAPKFKQKLELAKTLLSYDVSSPKNLEQLSLEHESCSGPFAFN